jgi:hypothetical protein
MSSSHRARRRANDPRAAGRRRIAGATTVSAVGGTTLAVLFGSLFAEAAAAPTHAAPVKAAVAAITVPAATVASAAPRPPAAAPQSATGDPAGSSGGS